LIGTVIGAVAIGVLTACFPQDRAPFLLGLALWGSVLRYVWHPSLFVFAVYMIVLSSMVLVAAR